MPLSLNDRLRCQSIKFAVTLPTSGILVARIGLSRSGVPNEQ